jgi:hypothetical protein
MATFHKFNDFTTQCGKGVHHLHAAGDVLKVMLTNEQPLAADTVKADMAEISSTSNGYPAGGTDIQNDISDAGSGVATMTGVDVTFTQSGASAIGPFQFVVLYNDTAGTPVKPLVGWWDYGSAVTLAGSSGETFLVDFGASILTLT